MLLLKIMSVTEISWICELKSVLVIRSAVMGHKERSQPNICLSVDFSLNMESKDHNILAVDLMNTSEETIEVHFCIAKAAQA